MKFFLGLALLSIVYTVGAVCNAGSCDSCKTNVCFELDGILDDAPVAEIKRCSNCGATPTCGPCTRGINGWECRPAGQPSCVGCNNNCCSQCIFSGVNDTRYCGALGAREWTLADVSSLVTEVDKLATVVSVTAGANSWVDVLQSVADVQGSDSFEFLSGNGAPVEPAVEALQQTMYVDTVAQQDNIVWTTSTTLRSGAAQDAADLQAAFASGNIRAVWGSKSNAFLIPPRSGTLSTSSPVDLAQQPPPLLPIVAYRGVCKQDTCRTAPGGTVDVPVVGGPGSLPGGLRRKQND